MTNLDSPAIRAIVQRIETKRRKLETLTNLVESAQLLNGAQHYARHLATDYLSQPSSLGGAISHFKRTDARTRAQITERYHWLLADMIEASMPGAKPRRIDFNALPRGARPYLIGPYLNIILGGRYPHLCFTRSNPEAGLLTYVTTGGPADPEHWRPHLSNISAWLGGNWVIADHTATTVTLTQRNELPAMIPFQPSWLKKDHLFFGINVETQRALHIALSDLTHLLIAGTPGTGKSVFLHTLMRSCLHSIDRFSHIYAVCGQGVAFERYRNLHPKLTVDNDPAHLHELAANLQSVMQQRTQRLIAERRDKMEDYILVVIDEWGAFNNPEGTDKAAKEAHAAFMQNMMHLGKRGRKVGIRLVVAIQEPVERDLATGIRAVLQSVVSFRLPVTAHATALFGEITPPAVPADPRTLPIGRAIHLDGKTGNRTLLHIPWIQPPGDRR